MLAASPLHPCRGLHRHMAAVGALAGALWLSACTSTPQRAPDGGAPVPPARPYATDGPLPDPPKDLDRVPDAEPRIEPIRVGGPNKPYQVAGEVYVPFTDDRALVESGLASWYGRKFHGRPTASGELYNMYAMTAAHPTLPIPSYARVRNPANGREVIVRINDRGPFAKGRIVDLSYTAALKLDVLRGVQPVELERITYEAIRSGRWRSDAAAASAAAAAVAAQQSGSADSAGPAPGQPVRQRELAGQDLALGVPGSDVAVRPIALPLPNPRPGAEAPVSLPTAAVAPTAAATQAVPAAPTALPVTAALPLPVAAQRASASSAGTATAERGDPPIQRDPVRTAAGRGWWVQLGAFRERTGALAYQGEMGRTAPWLAPLMGLFDERGLHKLQAGPFQAKGEALSMMDRLKTSLNVTPVLVERR